MSTTTYRPQATAFAHAHAIAGHMDMELHDLLTEQPEERALLVMLLFAIGYDERKIKDVLDKEGPWPANNIRAHLDKAINLWRTDSDRKRQYRIVLDRIERNDNESREKRASERAAQRAQRNEGAGAQPMVVAGGQREPFGIRAGSAKPARKEPPHFNNGQAHF